jgi:hypothetical protein
VWEKARPLFAGGLDKLGLDAFLKQIENKSEGDWEKEGKRWTLPKK